MLFFVSKKVPLSSLCDLFLFFILPLFILSSLPLFSLHFVSTRPWLFNLSCFSLVFISFPSSNFSPASHSPQHNPFAFFPLLLSLSLPFLILTVMSCCYFSQRLACHNLCRWVISVGLRSAKTVPEKVWPEKWPIPERWYHPLCQRKMTAITPGVPTWAAYTDQIEDGNCGGVVERGWKLTCDSIHPNTMTVYCQTSSNNYDLVVRETDRHWEKWFVLSYVL